MLGPGGTVGGGCGYMDLILTDRQLNPQPTKGKMQLQAAEGTDTTD